MLVMESEHNGSRSSFNRAIQTIFIGGTIIAGAIAADQCEGFRSPISDQESASNDFGLPHCFKYDSNSKEIHRLSQLESLLEFYQDKDNPSVACVRIARDGTIKALE
jgi:hypothetical protein